MNELRIGDRVYLDGRADYMTTTGNVSKITPAGFVDVTKASGETVRFNKHGYSAGESWDRMYIDLRNSFEEREAMIASLKRAQLAAEKLNAVCVKERVNGRWGKDELQNQVARLRALLNEAHEAVEAI